MKITWDNIDSFSINKKGNFKRGDRVFILVESGCASCSDVYFARYNKDITKITKFCCLGCSQSGKFNSMSMKAGNWKGGSTSQDVCLYSTYQPQLEPYGIECRCSDESTLEVKCHYNDCGKWFVPPRQSVFDKIKTIKGQSGGGNNLYCSNECKGNCSTFNKISYPKGYKPDSPRREHQAELRSILIKERGTTCEKCGTDVGDNIICHHILPVKVEPLESLDKDNCILVCYECDQTIHQKDGCKTGQLARC